LKASELFVKCLEAEGVEYVFGLPGEEIEDLLFSLRDSDIEFVPVRHEQGAAFMADVWGRIKGRAGVCLSTLGPGATNLLTGVADANLDKAPLVAITGQAGRAALHHESHQALDVVDMFRPVTKWNAQISHPGVVNESVRKAFKVAEFEKPGATHLEFPEDVAAEGTEQEPLPTRKRVRRPNPEYESVEAAADLLAEAERPLAIAGNGAVRMDASRCLRQFVEATGVPVVSTYMGKGAISDASEHSLMALHSGSGEGSCEALRRADLVVSVGYDVAEHDPVGWNPDEDVPVIHVDHDPAEVYQHYNPEVELVSDVSASLCELVQPCVRRSLEFGEWYGDVRQEVLDYVQDPGAREGGFGLRGVVQVLRRVMEDDDVLVSDVGSHKMAIAQNFPTFEPNTCIISNGLASMGISVPGGFAADLATDSNVVSVTGDGGFMMNASELETVKREGAGYTVVVLNDGNYGLITEKQESGVGQHFGTELTNPDFVQFASSFGIDAHRPEDWDEFESIMEDAVTSDELSLVEVVLTED